MHGCFPFHSVDTMIIRKPCRSFHAPGVMVRGGGGGGNVDKVSKRDKSVDNDDVVASLLNSRISFASLAADCGVIWFLGVSSVLVILILSQIYACDPLVNNKAVPELLSLDQSCPAQRWENRCAMFL
jgi:hypothetical protein